MTSKERMLRALAREKPDRLPVTKEEAKALHREHWTEPVRAKCGTGLSDYRVMSAAVLVTFVVLYLIFR